MRVVVLAPYRAGDERRDRIWDWVRYWYEDSLGYEVFCGDAADSGDVFSISKARNRLAADCGDWDVAVMIDADTIAEPGAIWEAVDRASKHNQLIMAGDVHMRMNQRSTDLIFDSDIWFPRPDGYLPKNGVNENCYGEPSSGVFAINHDLWDATGGFVEDLQGWGYDDLIFLTQCFVVGDGVAWTPDSTLLHFWHERPKVTEDTDRNRKIYNAFQALSEVDHKQAIEFLRGYGHEW